VAGRIRDDHEFGLVPTAEPAGAAYDHDFYSWSLEQARLLRQGRWDAVDREHVAEAIESLGREQFNKLESAFRVLLLHFFKWDHQPGARSRSWIFSIEAQRLEIEDVLTDDPGLEPGIADTIACAYRKARIEAAKKTGFDKTAFPETYAYSFAEIANRPFSL